MATNQMGEFIQRLRRAMVQRDGEGRTDGQLLEDHLSRGDEAALAILVQRHAPMVWGVCRRLLCNHQDAEDAFQAAFLVLVRKAAAVMPRELVANWLYGVAQQTALKARATAVRRRGRERQVAKMPEPAVTEQTLWHDLQSLLDEELSRLPDKYRVLIVLCVLEGKTRKEVSRQLGVPEGTVAGRLARARMMLAKRLTQRGVNLSGGALAAVLSQKAASASVPPSALSSTIKAVTLVAAGQTAATGVVSVKVAALTEGVLQSMVLTKLKTATMALVLLTALGGGAGLIYRTQAAEPPKVAEKKGNPTTAKNAVKRFEQTDEENAPPRFPAAPPPLQAVARVKDKVLFVTMLLPSNEADSNPPPVVEQAGAKSYASTKTSYYHLNKAQAFDTKGKAIATKKLAEILKKQTTVLVSADGRPVDPFYLQVIKEGTVVLILHSTLKKAAKNPKVYPVSDLVKPDAPESLIQLITKTIQPKSWAENGGEGIIDYHPLTGSLVIVHTPEIHEQVQGLLNALRRLSDKKLPQLKP